ncbi:MAG TPA: DinB family protein [Acidimicrobiia bacterium]|nr:DinB family protein [Acidimicrobiia bacterium]
MTAPSRRDVRDSIDEFALLERFLDFQRHSIVRKAQGLERDDATRSFVDSATTLLGIVKHLADVERWWFAAVFAGEQVGFRWTDEDPDADWRIEDDETVEGIVADYEAACIRSREIVAGRSPLDIAAHEEYRSTTLRWILVHMIEETARHAGHADILRELTDGVVGE